MRKFATFISLYSCLLLSIFHGTIAFAGKKSKLEKSGDMLQIINPIVAASISSQEKGLGHFGVVYGEALGIMGVTKLIGTKGKWYIARRPTGGAHKTPSCTGFPSGHTTSAWTAASYVRNFSEDYKIMAIPLYATAALTGYSRIEAKKHTVVQVVTAVALSEAVNILNAKLQWSNEYRTTTFNFGTNGASAGLHINL